MRYCLGLVLIGTTLHGAQALDRRPALAIRPSSRPHEILRGGAGNKQLVAPPLVEGRVKTIRRCIMASNVISFLILAVTLKWALALAWSTANVFNFVAQRLLRAWRPREFDQACVEMSQTPQSLLDLVLSIASIVALSYAAYQGRVGLLLFIGCLFAPTEPGALVKSFLNKSYQALKQL